MPHDHFFTILRREWVTFRFQWDDDDVRFVLKEHCELDLYSASWLKQQSTNRHVALHWHIILISSQPNFIAPTPYCNVPSGEAINTSV